MFKSCLFLLVLGTLASTPALADQLTLKNGDRLTGTILKSDGKVIVIHSEFAGDVSVQWTAIDAIQSTNPIYLTLKDGQTLRGTVTTDDGKYDVATKDAGNVATPKDNVTIVRNESEEAAYIAEMDRLKNPRLTDFWGGYVDTALSLTRGNSQTLNFVLGARAVRTTPRDVIAIYANSVFSNNGTNGPTVTTANAINGGIRVDFNVTDKLYGFGFTDFFHDEFQQLDLRNTLGGGLGYHAIKSKTTIFDVYGGADFSQAYYSTPLTQKSGEIVAGEFFSHAASDRTKFIERFEFFPNLSDTGQYRFTFNLGATTKINHWLNWQVSFNDVYVSNPPPLILKNDIFLSTGLRLTFGKGAS